MIIRKAEEKDLEELLAIYNYEVQNGNATFDIEPKTLEEWHLWFQRHSTVLHPLFVAETGLHIGGYVSLPPYREKEAYKNTAELSLYIAPSYRRQGIANQLMDYIIQAAKKENQIHTIISVITSSNRISIHLHEKYGFHYCGTIREVGLKNGAYLDIDNYQLLL